MYDDKATKIWRFCREWKVRQSDVEDYLEEIHEMTPSEEKVLDGANIERWRQRSGYGHAPERLVLRTMLSALRRLYAEISYDCDEETMGEADEQWEDIKENVEI